MAGCPNCGRPNPDEARFCLACGKALRQPAAAGGREVRKTVTVIFTDVSGWTRLGEQVDPEALRHVMTRYFERMRAVVESHGGTVEKFIGDAVMAVFGIPQLHEDDALRAVRAAAEMRQALNALNADLHRERGLTLAIRTGVNTGEVVAGDPGGGQELVIGDAVNVAARLEQVAEPGEILIGSATYRLVRDAVQIEALEPLVLKGKQERVTAFRLVEVYPLAPGRVRRLDSPMVGRHGELTLLRHAYERAVEARTCHLFTLLGVAGVGKSRLVQEFLHAMMDAATVLRGRCLPYGEGITFWPVGEAVRQAAGITQNDSRADARTKLESVLAAEPDGSLVAERLAQLLGLAGAAAIPEETFWAARKLLETIARGRALIVVFDDIQWAEATFLDLIEHIAEWTVDVPMFLLCLARPELLDSRPGWGGGRINGTSVLLEPLGPAESGMLIDNLLGAPFPEEVRLRVAESADGNPLFVEEMLAMLIDDGRLRRMNGHWVATSHLSRLSVPDTIQALLSARLDRLSPVERQVIERAAVEGEVFHRASVEQLVPMEARAGVLRSLIALRRKELIRPERAEFAGQEAFRFRHLLIRDAAYEAIPKEVRAGLHERFADWLLEAAGERVIEYEEVLGYHLERAYSYRTELGPPGQQETELARRASQRLAAAGRRALDRGDLTGGINLLERASSLVEDDDRRQLELLPDLGAALFEGGNMARAEAVLSEAVEKAQAAGNDRLEAHATIVRFSLRVQSRPELVFGLAAEGVNRCLAIFERAGDDLGLARCWRLLGDMTGYQGEAAAAESALEKAILHAHRAGIAAEEASNLSRLASLLTGGPRPLSDVVRRLEQMRAQSLGSRRVEAAVLSNLGMCELLAGRLEEARALRAKAQAIARSRNAA